MDLTGRARDLFTRLPVPVRGAIVWTLGFWRVRPVLGPLTYNQDGLASRHNADFMADPAFCRAYEAGWDTRSWDGHLHWRVHVLLWAAVRGAALEGDFVECGVNRGGYSRAIVEYLDFGRLPRTFWLLDTFCGLEESLVSDQEKQAGLSAGRYAECHDEVVRTFSPFSNVRIIKGAVPGTLDQVTAHKVAYLSLDMNCVEPEIAAARHFWDRLVPGAAMVLDDYGWKKHKAQKDAFDAFAREKGAPLLCLPTGQGLIMKPE